jgi:WS/DGAT/MGAT family acyltransferase
MRRLSGADAMMLRLDRGNAYNHTLKISIVDPSTDPEGWSFSKFTRLFEERVHLLPSLRLRYLPTPLGVHHPIWVEDPEFNLASHVRRVMCPGPGGMAEFCALVEQLYARPLDPQRPLWESWVIEGLEGGRVGIVTLLHHAYTDGVGALGMLEDVYTAEPDDGPREEPPFSPPPLPSAVRRLAWGLRDLPAVARRIPSAVTALRERRRLERGFAESGRELPPSPFDSSLTAPFRRGLSRDRRFACESFPLDQVLEVRKALGATINDVFLACAAGALRRWLAGADAPSSEAMVGTMAFSTLPLAERSVAGNYSSIDYVRLHSEIADPLERLRAASASAKVTKDHFNETKDADIVSVVEVAPGGLVNLLAQLNARTGGRFDPFANVVVSNVPGPREPLYVGRWRLDRWFSTGQLTHGANLNLTVWSYAGQFNLCVLGDAQAVPDAWQLINGFRASLDELLAIAREEAAVTEMTVPDPQPASAPE